MNILVLRTFTADCEKNWRSLECLGHTCTVIQYDADDRTPQMIVDLAAMTKPDAIVYIGAIEKYHGRRVLAPGALCELRGIAPTIHICGDGSDEPWWEWLDAYDRAGCFACQVSIDGSQSTPIAGFKNGMVRLTPTDPFAFPATPWEDRLIPSAFPGGLGHGARAELVAHLTQKAKGFEWRNSSTSYGEMAVFMSNAKIIVNSPMNGSGTGDHVKGRVVETGFAGACLLERAGSPTSRWFRAGVDYLEYTDPDSAVVALQAAAENDGHVRTIAERFAARVRTEHHPRVFWRDVFAKAGVKTCNKR